MGITMEQRLESVLTGEVRDVDIHTNHVLQAVIARTGNVQFLRWAARINFLALPSIEEVTKGLDGFDTHDKRVAFFTSNHTLFLPNIQKGISKRGGNIFDFVTSQGMTKWIRTAYTWKDYVDTISERDLRRIFVKNKENDVDYDWFVGDYMSSLLLDLGYYIYSTVIMPHKIYLKDASRTLAA